jgi:hypothetical protein
MHAPNRPRQNFNPARITRLARLWLKCIAALLTCAAHLLPPSHQRRLPVLDLPPRVLARHVARLIFLCAIFQATPPKTRAPQAAATMSALLRAGVQRHLTDTHGVFDLARIARTCANPERAITAMITALERGLTRRAPILPRAGDEPLCPPAPIVRAATCDTS